MHVFVGQLNDVDLIHSYILQNTCVTVNKTSYGAWSYWIFNVGHSY